MVGLRGTILRAENETVASARSSPNVDLNDVWGTSDYDVWVVGAEATLLHWNGVVWKQALLPVLPLPKAGLVAVSGAGPSDVWVGGEGGTHLHFDGSSWTIVQVDPLSAVSDIWAAGPDDAWVTTSKGILRCSANCAAIALPDATIPARVRGLSADDVYFMGNGGELDHVISRRTGGSWTLMELPPHTAGVDLHVLSSNEVWVSTHYYFDRFTKDSYAVQRWDGAAWVPVLTSEERFQFNGVWASAEDDVWAVGNSGQIHHVGASGPKRFHSGPLYRTEGYRAFGDLTAIASSPTSMSPVVSGLGERVWIDEEEALWAATSRRPDWYGTSWDQLSVSRSGKVIFTSEARTPPFGTVGLDTWILSGIHGSSSSNVWWTDFTGVYRWNGEVVEKMPADGWNLGFLGPVWAIADDNVWFGGNKGVFHWEGRSFTETPLGASIWALWGTWAKDVWAVGERSGAPVTFHWNGGEWSEVPLPAGAEVAGRLRDVIGHCADDVYAIGEHLLFHWDGAAWVAVPAPLQLGTVTAGAQVGAELWVTGVLPGYLGNSPMVMRRPW